MSAIVQMESLHRDAVIISSGLANEKSGVRLTCQPQTRRARSGVQSMSELLLLLLVLLISKILSHCFAHVTIDLASLAISVGRPAESRLCALMQLQFRLGFHSLLFEQGQMARSALMAPSRVCYLKHTGHG